VQVLESSAFSSPAENNSIFFLNRTILSIVLAILVFNQI
jgi:hypothetical protein